MTNYDHITLSPEILSEYLAGLVESVEYDGIRYNDAAEGWVEWLNQPYACRPEAPK